MKKRIFLAAALLSFLLLACSHVPLVPDSHTVALWHFDEGSGTVLHDASPNHNDGKIVSARWVPGRFGTALHFDGATSYVIFPNTASLKPPTAMTIEAWISLDTLEFPPDNGYGSGAAVVSNLGSYPLGGGYELGIMTGGELQFDYRCSYPGPISRFSRRTQIPAANKFYHLAATYQRVRLDTVLVTLLKTYLDGVMTDSVAYPDRIQYSDTPNFYIGTNCDGHALHKQGIREFPGIIDEVRISDIARDPSSFGDR